MFNVLNHIKGGGFIGLLNQYPGAAAAYSVRRLSSTYTGNLIEVRRTVSAVTVTADVSFDSNNELSLDSEISVTSGSSNATNLGEFVAAAGYSDPDSLGSGQNAFVRTWYDQSGNGNDATQTTAANQPQIVSSGSVITENGKPSLSFDGTDDGLTLTSNYVIPTTFSTSWVFKRTASLIHSISFANNSQLYPFLSIWFTNDYIYFRPGSDGGAFKFNISSTGQFLIMDFYKSNTWNLYRNGNSLASLSYTSSALNLNSLGNRNGTSHNGLYQEFIIWNSDQSSNRTGIETNINDYYSIY